MKYQLMWYGLVRNSCKFQVLDIPYFLDTRIYIIISQLYLSGCLSVRLSVCPLAWLFFCLFVRLHGCLSVRLPVCPFSCTNTIYSSIFSYIYIKICELFLSGCLSVQTVSVCLSICPNGVCFSVRLPERLLFVYPTRKGRRRRPNQ